MSGPPRTRLGTRERVQRWIGILTAVVASMWGARLVAGTPPLIAGAAAAPVALYAGIVVWCQRGEGRPGVLLLASLLWGAVGAASLSNTTNELARAWINVLAGTDDARVLTSMLVAPIIEEAAKATGFFLLLLVQRDSIAGVRDGIVYGALVGIGFVLAESLLYLGFAVLEGGEASFVRSIYLRGVLAGGNHAVFTATVGAGIGWARAATSGRARTLGLGLAVAAALLQHLAWNAIAAGAIVRALCGAAVAGGACLPAPAAVDLLVVVPLVTALFLGPGTTALLWLSRRSGAVGRA
jgi:RsiW-degrading membrane proteinase PrsW (M82 family)